MIEAAAWCGISENDFWEMTPRYLQALIKGKTTDSREAWMIGRQVAYWSILPHMGKKRIRPQDLGRFGWEQSKKLHNPYGTPENLKAELQKFKEICATLEFKPSNIA